MVATTTNFTIAAFPAVASGGGETAAATRPTVIAFPAAVVLVGGGEEPKAARWTGKGGMEKEREREACGILLGEGEQEEG